MRRNTLAQAAGCRSERRAASDALGRLLPRRLKQIPVHRHFSCAGRGLSMSEVGDVVKT